MNELEQLRAERDFLLLRAKAAGQISFGGDRWTGMSSNALVEVAFGGENDRLPSDSSDLAACYRTVMRLPPHLRTDAVMAQLERGVEQVASKYPDDAEWARKVSGWDDRDTDGSPKGPDPQGLDGEAATAGAEGIAQRRPQ